MEYFKIESPPKDVTVVLRVVAWYGLFAAAWFFLLDSAVRAVFQDSRPLAGWTVATDAVFIVVTALLLYRLIRRMLRSLSAAQTREAELVTTQGRTLQLLWGLLDNLPDLIYFKDERGVYRLSNAQHARWVGRPPQQIVGTSDINLFDEKSAAEIQEDDRQTMAGGSTRSAHQTLPDRSSGAPRAVQSIKIPLTAAGPGLRGILGVMWDVTDLVESQERYRALFEDSHLAVVIFDPESGLILEGNRSAARIYGLPDVAALRGLSPAATSAPKQYDGRVPEQGIAEHIQQTMAQGYHRFEWRHQRPDGTIWDGELHAMCLQLGGRRLMQVILRDITHEKALEADKRRMLQLLSLAEQAAHAGAWHWDIVHDRHYWSPALLRLFGLEADGNQTDFDARAAWRQVLHPDDRAECEARFMESLQKQQPFVHSYRVVLPSGECRWIDAFGAVTLNGAGSPQNYAGLCLDATARKAAEAELQQYRDHLEALVEARTAALQQMERRAQLLLDSAANGMIGMDGQGRIVVANPAACEILGYRPDELQGQDLHGLLHHHRPDGNPYPADECPNLRTLQYGEVVRNDDDVYWHRDGHALPLITSCHPLHEEGRVTGAVLSFVDVSALKAAAVAREQALAAAEQLSGLRQEFLRNMSHELRTPLNGVLGFSQIGRLHIDNPQKCAHAFEKIMGAGQQALNLVNDILNYSRLEGGTLAGTPTAFAPAQLLDKAIESVRDQAEAKGLALTASIATTVPKTCVGLPGQLGRALRELLVNAAKFTPSGKIETRLERRQMPDEDWLVFKVADTGPGIEASRLPEIFEPFHQLDGSLSRSFGGTGLGLALTKRLIDRMGGNIRVESTPGLGCLFEFQVPCRAVDERAATPVEAALPAQALAGLTILAVEDEPLDQSVIQSLLLEYGALTILAGSGEQALELVDSHGPGAFDLVLMDLKLPGIDGFQTAARLRARPPQLPVLALTGLDTEANRQRCRQEGFADFVVKPIEVGTLIRAILKHVGEGAKTAPTATTGTGETVDPAAWHGVVDELLARLHRDDFSCVSLLAQNDAVLRSALGQAYPAIAEAIRNFNFADARAHLEATTGKTS